jgi:hypothetical protein
LQELVVVSEEPLEKEVEEVQEKDMENREEKKFQEST